MEFEHEAHEQAYNKVGELLKESFGQEGFMQRPDAPVYVGVAGSALVEVGVLPWGDDDATVNIRSCCVMDMGEIPPDCLRFLLDENYKFRFGAFTIDGDGDINFEDTIAATKLDREELASSVQAVQGTADRYDNKIIEQWGGVTAREKFTQAAQEAGLTPG